MLVKDKNGNIVVSALRARANFGTLLRRVDEERRSLFIEKRGTPTAVLLSIRDYVRLAAPEPEVLEVLGRESQHKGRISLRGGRLSRSSRPPELPSASADDPAPAGHRYGRRRICRPKTRRAPAYCPPARDHQTG